MTLIWIGTGELTAVLCQSFRGSETAWMLFFWFSFFGARGQDGEDKAVSGQSSDGCVPREFFAQGRWLGLFITFKRWLFFFVSLDVVALLSPLIPGVSCFCKNKGLHKNRERNREFARWQIWLQKTAVLLVLTPDRGLLAKCWALICLWVSPSPFAQEGRHAVLSTPGLMHRDFDVYPSRGALASLRVLGVGS